MRLVRFVLTKDVVTGSFERGKDSSSFEGYLSPLSFFEVYSKAVQVYSGSFSQKGVLLSMLPPQLERSQLFLAYEHEKSVYTVLLAC